MAIAAINIYTEGQNGHTEITVSPDTAACPAFHPNPAILLRSPLAEVPAATAQVTTFAAAPKPEPPLIRASPQAARRESEEAGLASSKRRANSLYGLVERFKNESGHLADSTRQKLECHFKVAAEYLDFNRDVGSITLADLRQLKSSLSNGRKASSVNDIMFKAIGALFRMALEDEIIERSPLDKLKRAKKGEPDRQQPTWEQAQEIQVEVGRYASETAIIIGFMRNFGVGQAEIRQLNGEHVDCDENVIHFRRRKTCKPFDVPIFPFARAFIRQLRDQGRFQVGKTVVKWRNPRKALESACERLGLPAYEPRALRRCFIVYCLQKGTDARVLAKWQGHRDAKLIFSVYGKHIDQSYEQEQAEMLGGVIRGTTLGDGGLTTGQLSV